MTILVFSPEDTGHHMEYLHHIYAHVCPLCPKAEFVFVVPFSFKEKAKQLVWESRTNVRFDFLSEEECKSYRGRNGAWVSFVWARLLRSRIKRYRANYVYAQHLMKMLPAAGFVFPKGVKLSGIIYKIYLYEWQKGGLVSRTLDVLKYLLLTKTRTISKILILNDSASVCYLNRLWHTDRFVFLPDPFVSIRRQQNIDLRLKYGLNKSDLVLSHFGSLSLRKGTMSIVAAIIKSTEVELKDRCFIFAGKVGRDIRDSFYKELGPVNNLRVIVEDDFCSYDYLYALCSISDVILMPYKETAQSSGLIGYASQFGVPVIAPKTGFIGKLVRRYRLGLTIPNTSPDSLREAFNQVRTLPRPTKRYCEDHTVQLFANVLIGTFTSYENR